MKEIFYLWTHKRIGKTAEFYTDGTYQYEHWPKDKYFLWKVEKDTVYVMHVDVPGRDRWHQVTDDDEQRLVTDLCALVAIEDTLNE